MCSNFAIQLCRHDEYGPLWDILPSAIPDCLLLFSVHDLPSRFQSGSPIPYYIWIHFLNKSLWSSTLHSALKSRDALYIEKYIKIHIKKCILFVLNLKKNPTITFAWYSPFSSRTQPAARVMHQFPQQSWFSVRPDPTLSCSSIYWFNSTEIGGFTSLENKVTGYCDTQSMPKSIPNMQ